MRRRQRKVVTRSARSRPFSRRKRALLFIILQERKNYLESDRKQREVLHHHADLLSLGQSPHRTLLHHGRLRHHRTLQARQGLRRDVPHRHRRARSEDRGQGKGRRTLPQGIRRRHCRQFQEAVGIHGHFLRSLHPHHRRLPCGVGAEDLP